MIRALCCSLFGSVVALSLGCRTSAPSHQPTPDPTSTAGEPDSSQDPTGEPDPPEPTEGSNTPERGGWASLGGPSSCELGCAEIYACVIVEGEHGETEAAAIELGCLDACVSTGLRENDSLFGCALPAERERERCVEFLGCAREAWPDSTHSARETRPMDPDRGCDRACRALAKCLGVYESEDDLDAVALCSEQCVEALTPELELEAQACTELSTCEEIERCITSLPGAR